MTTATLAAKAIQKKITTISLPRISWKAAYVVGVALLLCMAVWYVMGINALTAGAYTIKTYQKQFNKLVDESRALEANFAETGFLGGFLEKAKAHHFEKTTEITYIKILENSFAKAE